MDKNQPSEPEDYSHFGYYGSYARWLSVCAYSPEDYSHFGYYCSTCGCPVEGWDGSMTEAVVASLHRGRIPQQWAICTHCGSDSGFTTDIPKD